MMQQMQILQKWFDRLSGMSGLARGILGVLVVFSLWLLASLFWLVVSPTSPSAPVYIALGSGNDSGPGLAAYPLFSEQAPATASPLDNGQFELQGVFKSSNPALSSAVIKNGSDSREYRVGAPIQGTPYTLAEVGWNTAALQDASGQRYQLKMGQLGLQNPSVNAPVSGGFMNNSGDNSQINGYNTSVPPEAASTGVERALAAGAASLSNNPASALTDMGLTPTGQGYEVTAQTPEATRRGMGLQPGDKITAINGHRLGSPQQDAQVLEQMRRDRSGVIEVTRGNQVITTQQRF